MDLLPPPARAGRLAPPRSARAMLLAGSGDRSRAPRSEPSAHLRRAARARRPRRPPAPERTEPGAPCPPPPRVVPAPGCRPCPGPQGFAGGAKRSSPGPLAMLRIASPTPERSPASCAPALDASPLLRCAPTSNELRRPRSLPGPSARPAPMCAAQPPTATAGWAASPAGPVRGARGRTVSFVRPGPPGGDASTAGYSFRSRVYRNSRQTRPFSEFSRFGKTRRSELPCRKWAFVSRSVSSRHSSSRQRENAPKPPAHGAPQVYLAFDADGPGVAAAIERGRTLGNVGAEWKRLRPVGVKDWNEALVAGHRLATPLLGPGEVTRRRR